MKNKRGLIKKKFLGKIALFMIFVLLVAVLVYASTFIDKSQSDFNLGTYNNTLYNASVGAGAVQLNLSYNNGTYTSQIFNTGSNVSLNNLSWVYQRIQCPQNMSYINKLNGYCIDQYEASMPSANSTTIGNSSDVALINNPGTMMAVSKPGVVPWVGVSANSARTACANAGKHLCTSEEWLGAANINGIVYNLPTDLAASPNFCNTGDATNCVGHSYNYGDACNTGKNKIDGWNNCTSAEGVYDMVGNVLEWTNETVSYTKPCTPATVGYCYWNGTGWGTSGTVKYGNDGVYFLANTVTGYAVQRGGTWTYGAVAGPFCARLTDGPAAVSNNVGFRCCSS
jgi:hypothetical protein